MPSFTEKRIAGQRIETMTPRQRAETGRRTIKVYQNDSTPSWKRYGRGTAKVEVSAAISREDGIPHIEFWVSETSLASEAMGEKRDVTKEAHFTAFGPAALEIFETLREVFEPAAAPKADVA